MNNIMDLNGLKEYMDKEGMERLDELDNFASKSTSNWGGMVIRENSTGELVWVQEVWGDNNYKDIKECKIEYKYSEESEYIPYFEYNGEDYFLDEFVRNNL